MCVIKYSRPTVYSHLSVAALWSFICKMYTETIYLKMKRRQRQYKSSQTDSCYYTLTITVIRCYSHTHPLHSCAHTCHLILSLSRRGFPVIRHSCALTQGQILIQTLVCSTTIRIVASLNLLQIRNRPADIRKLCDLGRALAFFYLSWKLAFLFSTNAVMPSLRSSCREQHRHTHHDWTVNTRVDTLLPRSETLLTVAKVAWNKRFSKRLPSAKVSS